MSLFVPAGTAALAQTSALSVEEARTIVAPLYEALNEPAKKDVAKLLAKATSPGSSMARRNCFQGCVPSPDTATLPVSPTTF